MGGVWIFVLVMLQWMSQASSHPFIDGLLRNDTEGLEASVDTVDEQVVGIESVPYTIISSDNHYEKRLYPAMTMACSEMVYNITEEDGGEETDGKVSSMMNMYRRMTTQLLKKKPSRLMFMKLFRYISGLNEGVDEIPMTSPVLSLVMPLAKRRIHKQMCFYLGKRFNTVGSPKPRNREVEIITKGKFEVYVHTFGGYALKDANWIEESEKFKVRLNEEKVVDFDEIDFSKFLTAGYDSPMKFWNRRNEILFNIGGEAEASEDEFNNNTDSVQDSFDEQSGSVKVEVHNLEALDQHNDEISMNVRDEEEQHVEVKEDEAQSSDSNLNQHHDLNLTEDEIGEENIEKESDFPQDAFYDDSYQAADNFQTIENRTINGNFKN